MKNNIKLFTLLSILFYSQIGNVYSQWQPIGPDSCIDMTVKNNVIFATGYTGLWKTTNDGVNWTAVNNDLPSMARILCNNGTEIFTSTGSNIYKTSNDGINWIQSSNGITATQINCLTLNNNRLYVGCNNGLFMSTNAGSNWSYVGLDTIRITGIDFYSSNTIVICGTNQQFLERIVFQSTNNGINWSNISGIIDTTHYYPRDVKILGQNIYINAVNNLYQKNISGGSWISLKGNGFPLGNIEFEKMFIINQYLIVTLEDWNQTIFISHNNGINFHDISLGISNGTPLYIYDVIALNSYAFACTYSRDLYRRPLQQIIGIQTVSIETPKKFNLYQNYPNPFNPTTNITFDIRAKGMVKLIVSDALGREVVTLVYQELQPGSYKADFEATNYPSGIYFCRLETKNFAQTKKMILIK